MRCRITFSKNEAMRYTSHLDVYRAWERTIRRAGLPLAYSHGFKPHPRINLASALPLGITSSGELVDIWLSEDIPVESIQLALSLAIPPGLFILNVTEIDSVSPTLQNQVIFSVYKITFFQPVEYLEEQINNIRKSNQIIHNRHDKQFDLRSLISDIHCLPNDDQGKQRIQVTLSAKEAATGRPEDIVQVLGIKPELTRIHRDRLITKEPWE